MAVAPTQAPGDPSPARDPSPTDDPGAGFTMEPEPTPPPLGVDWSKAPSFPSPLLSAGTGRGSKAAGTVGCQTVFYEPPNDTYLRTASRSVPCRSGDVQIKTAVVVRAGDVLVFEAAERWSLGAQFIPGTAPFGPFIVVRGIAISDAAPGTRSVSPELGLELASEEGFFVPSITAVAPTAPGNYLVMLDAQNEMPQRTWRSMGLVYVWWVRVTP